MLEAAHPPMPVNACSQTNGSSGDSEILALPKASLRRPSLRYNIVCTLVGNLVYAGCQWGMLVVLAKLGSPELVGVFGLALAVTNPVIMLTNLQLGVLQATDATKEYRFGDYLAVRLLMNIVALAIVFTIVAVQGYAPRIGLAILMMGLAKAIEAISDVIYGALQQHERVDYIAVLQVIKGVISLSLVSLVVYAGGSIAMAVSAMAGMWLICLVTCELPGLARLFRVEGTESLAPRWDRARIQHIVRYAFPLGAAMMLGSLTLNLPQLFIEHYRGLHDLGIFVALSSLMLLGRKVINPIVHTSSARLSHLYAEGDGVGFRTVVWKLFLMTTVIGLIAVILSIVVGREALRLIYAPEYANHLETLVWLMVAFALSCQSALDPAFTALRCMREPVILWGATLILLGGGLLYLTPKYGLNGAAMAIALSSAGRLVLMVIALKISIDQKFTRPLSNALAGSLDNDSFKR